MTKIVSYNVNGIRSAIEKEFVPWLDEHQFDVVCLQETKAHSGSIPVLLFKSLGYELVWHSARRKGYSGVATFTKTKPLRSFCGIGIEKYDVEGRILRTDFPDWTLLNCYFPNGGSGPERQEFKMRFLDDFLNYIDLLREDHPNLVVCGDFNIAHTKIDIDDPVRNNNSSGFRLEERQWMTDWLASGFVDAYRRDHPDTVSYTWWRVTQFMRAVNRGWRLDYFSVSDEIASQIVSVEHLQDAMHSDHCPIAMEIDLET